jgi:hypothetical protein
MQMGYWTILPFVENASDLTGSVVTHQLILNIVSQKQMYYVSSDIHKSIQGFMPLLYIHSFEV